MKKIITASEASQLSSHGRERMVEAELEKIMNKIAYRSSEGETFLTLDDIYKENVDKLKELGYIVNFIKNIDYGGYYSIRWGERECIKEKKKWWWQK
jgi:hypothetical protein